MTPGVTIVILNWNGKHFLRQFLPSVLATTYKKFEILVVDNGSTDGSIAFLKKKFKSVRLLKLDKNYGFTTGNNKALAHISTKYLVLLNSDVEVDPGWLDPLVKIMEGDEKVAVAQPKIRSYQNKEFFEYAGAAGGYIDALGYPFCRGRIFSTIEKDEGQYDQQTEIFWASGCACFIRKSVTDELGMLEDRFFAHMEEIDFCWRARNNGYKVMYCPKSVVYHVGGGTLNRANPHKTYLNIRNSLAALFLNFPRWQVPYKFFIRLLLDGVLGAKSLLEGEPALVWAIIRAHWAMFFSLPYWIKKRRKNYGKVERLAALGKGYFPGSIVWKYFVQGKKGFRDLGI